MNKYYVVEQQIVNDVETSITARTYDTMGEAFMARAERVWTIIESYGKAPYRVETTVYKVVISSTDIEGVGYVLTVVDHDLALGAIIDLMEREGKAVRVDKLCPCGEVIGRDCWELKLGPDVMATEWDDSKVREIYYAPYLIRKCPKDWDNESNGLVEYKVHVHRTEDGSTKPCVFNLDDIGDWVFVNIFLHLV